MRKKGSKRQVSSPKGNLTAPTPVGSKTIPASDVKEKVSKSESPHSSRVPEFFTADQIADLLQLNKATVYRLVKLGRLGYLQIGRLKRFQRIDIEELLRPHTESSISEGMRSRPK